MTTKWRQWPTSLVSAQPTHKSGLTTSIHTTQTPITYLTNKASPASSGMLWRQKGSWHRMKKTSRVLHKILGLCNLWTLGLGNGTLLTLLLPLHTKRMSIIHLYLLFYSPHRIFTPRSGQSSSSYPLERQVAHYVGQLSQLLYNKKNTNRVKRKVSNIIRLYSEIATRCLSLFAHTKLALRPTGL